MSTSSDGSRRPTTPRSSPATTASSCRTIATRTGPRRSATRSERGSASPPADWPRSANPTTRSTLWRRVLTQDPYDEGAHRSLVATLRAEGRLGEARDRLPDVRRRDGRPRGAPDDVGRDRSLKLTSGRIRKDFKRVTGARSDHDEHHRCHHRIAPVGHRRPGRPPLLLEPPGDREGRRRRLGLRTRARRVRRAAWVRTAAARPHRGGRADVRPRR